MGSWGQTLQDAWATLSDAEKHDVAAEIKRHLRHLRATQGPGGFCSLDNLPLRDTLFSTGHANDLLRCAGPFSSESDLVDAIVRKCRASESLQGKASFYADNLPLVFQDHVPILSHGDLQRKNIMVRAESAQGSTVAFLDWEFAGWYPTFWEFAQTVCGCGLFDDDWVLLDTKVSRSILERICLAQHPAARDRLLRKSSVGLMGYNMSVCSTHSSESSYIHLCLLQDTVLF